MRVRCITRAGRGVIQLRCKASLPSLPPLPDFKKMKLRRQNTFDTEALERELDVLKHRLTQEVIRK